MSRRTVKYRKHMRESADVTAQVIVASHSARCKKKGKSSTSEPISLDKAQRIARTLHRTKR